MPRAVRYLADGASWWWLGVMPPRIHSHLDLCGLVDIVQSEIVSVRLSVAEHPLQEEEEGSYSHNKARVSEMGAGGPSPAERLDVGSKKCCGWRAARQLPSRSVMHVAFNL